MGSERKAGVAYPEELRKFVEEAGDNLLFVDLRNPNAQVEPEDQASISLAGLPNEDYRPKAVHIPFDRAANIMPLPEVPKDTPIITHCGAGGRGQLAKEFLIANGFNNVINGGGPKEKECWEIYGSK